MPTAAAGSGAAFPPLPAALADDVAAVQGIPAVESILDVVCRTTGMRFAAVARVTQERWIACSVQDTLGFGLEPGGELKVETTICNEIRGHRKPVIIDDVPADSLWAHHHTPATYGFRSYISMPISLPDGEFFGTLCAIDPQPANLNRPEVVETFKLFAELIAFHLDAGRRVQVSEDALRDEREVARLREQFIAVLGHDLRNPLASIANAVSVLERTPLTEPATGMVAMMKRSARRMGSLIDDVLDFARARLGSGLSLNFSNEPLQPALEQVVSELRMVFPHRAIETDFRLDVPIYCDRGRIARLLSNLLANALAYGDAAAPVHARATIGHDMLELSVTNAGPAIPPATVARLFAPFARGDVKPSQQGLGLGLFIAFEIARAHGGTLSASSSGTQTCFTLRMPVSATH